MPKSNIMFLPCEDLKETVAFYTGIIGITVNQVMGDCVILDSGYGYLGFCNYGDGRPLAQGICISFNEEDTAGVDRMYAKILKTAPEILVEKPKQHDRFAVYSFFLKDPNGYLVEIQKIL